MKATLAILFFCAVLFTPSQMGIMAAQTTDFTPEERALRQQLFESVYPGGTECSSRLLAGYLTYGGAVVNLVSLIPISGVIVGPLSVGITVVSILLYHGSESVCSCVTGGCPNSILNQEEINAARANHRQEPAAIYTPMCFKTGSVRIAYSTCPATTIPCTFGNGCP